MSAYDCRPSRTHDFDPVSGWCAHGCGVRDDGRIVSTMTGKPVSRVPERRATASQAVEHALPRPTEPSVLFQARAEPYIDFTEPRRGADR